MKWKYSLGILLLIIFSILFFKNGHKKQLPSSLHSNNITVLKYKVIEKPWQDSIQSMGNVIASKSIFISNEIPGIVEKIYFDSGQVVSQGQLLLTLRSDVISATLEKAKVMLRDDLHNYQRKKQLLPLHYISLSDVEHAKALVEKDEFDIKQQEALLAQHKIIAPFSGILGLSQVQIGQYIKSGQSLVSLEKADPVYVDFPVSEKNLSKIKIGGKVVIKSDAYPNEIFSGVILASSNAINVNNRSILVRAVVPNSQIKLLSGLAVLVSIKQTAVNKIILPQSVLTYNPNGVGVYVIDNQKRVHFRPVVTGERHQDEVVINSGVAKDEIVVMAGQNKLHDGVTLSK